VTGIRNERWQWWKNDVLILVALVACTKFGVNRPKQTKVIEKKLNFFFSNNDLDLDHRHLGSNPKLPLDISYPYSKFGVNRPKQTKVIERNPKVDARPHARPPARRRLQHYNNPVFVEKLVRKQTSKWSPVKMLWPRLALSPYFPWVCESLTVICLVCWILYGPFCHGAIKLDISTLFTTFFLWTSL